MVLSHLALLSMSCPWWSRPPLWTRGSCATICRNNQPVQCTLILRLISKSVGQWVHASCNKPGLWATNNTYVCKKWSKKFALKIYCMLVSEFCVWEECSHEPEGSQIRFWPSMFLSLKWICSSENKGTCDLSNYFWHSWEVLSLFEFTTMLQAKCNLLMWGYEWWR